MAIPRRALWIGCAVALGVVMVVSLAIVATRGAPRWSRPCGAIPYEKLRVTAVSPAAARNHVRDRRQEDPVWAACTGWTTRAGTETGVRGLYVLPEDLAGASETTDTTRSPFSVAPASLDVPLNDTTLFTWTAAGDSVTYTHAVLDVELVAFMNVDRLRVVGAVSKYPLLLDFIVPDLSRFDYDQTYLAFLAPALARMRLTVDLAVQADAPSVFLVVRPAHTSDGAHTPAARLLQLEEPTTAGSVGRPGISAVFVSNETLDTSRWAVDLRMHVPSSTEVQQGRGVPTVTARPRDATTAVLTADTTEGPTLQAHDTQVSQQSYIPFVSYFPRPQEPEKATWFPHHIEMGAGVASISVPSSKWIKYRGNGVTFVVRCAFEGSKFTVFRSSNTDGTFTLSLRTDSKGTTYGSISYQNTNTSYYSSAGSVTFEAKDTLTFTPGMLHEIVVCVSPWKYDTGTSDNVVVVFDGVKVAHTTNFLTGGLLADTSDPSAELLEGNSNVSRARLQFFRVYDNYLASIAVGNVPFDAGNEATLLHDFTTTYTDSATAPPADPLTGLYDSIRKEEFILSSQNKWYARSTQRLVANPLLKGKDIDAV